MAERYAENVIKRQKHMAIEKEKLMLISKTAMQRILTKIGALVKADAIRRCPVDMGQLRMSIDFEVGESSVTIFSRLPYAAYQEFGTGIYHINSEGLPEPHEGWDIVPKDKKALRFEVGPKGKGGGKVVFAKKVHIEGMQPHPYLRPAVHENLEGMSQIIKAEMGRQ